MHPLLSNPQRVAWYLAGWLFLSLPWIRLAHTSLQFSFWAAAVLVIPVMLVTGIICSSAYYLCKAMPSNRRSLGQTLMAFGLSSIVSALLVMALISAWHQALTLLALNEFQWQWQEHQTWLLGGSAAILFLVNLLAYDVFLSFEQVRISEQAAAAAQLAARDAELQVLRSQIDPHFLFNSLNSVSALTTIAPERAREMTIALADFFRLTLRAGQDDKIRLQDELQLCHHFLTVEGIRFGPKLQYQPEVAEGLNLALIPSMLIQPLLENAIKHGIQHLRKGGCIRLQIHADQGWLHIQIHNPVADSVAADERSNAGLGLRNLSERCQAMYAGRARVSHQSADGLFSLSVTLPLEFAAS
ncbi:sensor histidine kinase [Undibacterium squillarum]|uniref:Signal transduction histidine kinase internal region domain-containing protein n=1 Tax=Undibacterium squillarum TaxID=1131567 RepID=A0ABQ2XU96_9BURK|nr:histidine kinase [Undibacterium squillarum]GGX32935.1 hypothetical protein GCM10010946_07840 [Undibacterium squillarum]